MKTNCLCIIRTAVCHFVSNSCVPGLLSFSLFVFEKYIKFKVCLNDRCYLESIYVFMILDRLLVWDDENEQNAAFRHHKLIGPIERAPVYALSYKKYTQIFLNISLGVIAHPIACDHILGRYDSLRMANYRKNHIYYIKASTFHLNANILYRTIIMVARPS